MAAACDDAQRDAEERRQHERGYRQHRGVACRAANQRADRPVVEKRVAEVEAHGPHRPSAKLRQRTAIEIESLARARDVLGPRARTKLGCEVAGGEPCEQERGRRNRDDEQQREDETAKEEMDQRTDNISAFQSATGRSTDGFTPSTRTL